MSIWALLIVWVFMIGFAILFFTWIIVSNSHFTWKLLQPGRPYQIDGRHYIFPNLPCIGPSYLLKDSFVRTLRLLLRKTSELLNALHIEWWVTGGTLMGIKKCGTVPFPFDDDVDIGVDDQKHRTFMFSQQFVDAAKQHHLEVVYIRRSSSRSADRTGACVRLQLPKHAATLDIFFWRTIDAKVIKLDGWSGANLVFNAKEQFRFEDVYPIHHNQDIDEMKINMPNNPIALLKQQYGEGVLNQLYVRTSTVSHLFPWLCLHRGLYVINQPPG